MILETHALTPILSGLTSGALRFGVKMSSLTLFNPNKETLHDYADEYEVDASLSVNVSDNTKYYLRGIFYKEGTNKYCGFTWNGQDWYNGPFTASEGWKNLLPVYISSASAQIKIKAKLDPIDKDCQSSGNYFFKIQRYTEKGSSVIDDQNEQKIYVSVSFATPTFKTVPSKSPTPSSVSKPKTEPILSGPSSTANVIKPAFSISVTSPVSSESSMITILPSLTGDMPASVAGLQAASFINIPLYSLFLGISLIFISAVLSFRKLRKS